MHLLKTNHDMLSKNCHPYFIN